jgi:hypothetical protein
MQQCTFTVVAKTPRVDGNEISNHPARRGSLRPLIGPEPADGISQRVSNLIIRDWVYREHQQCWQSIPGQRHPMSFLSKLSAKRTVEFLKLNKTLAKEVTALLTGHCHLKGHPPLQTGNN